jgi:hypothetical protein
MKRLNIIIITILICALSQAQNPPYRNGQRLTDYNFPLFGDVKTIEYTCFSILELVDYGYFDESEIVEYRDNSIRIIRNSDTKVVENITFVDSCE